MKTDVLTALTDRQTALLTDIQTALLTDRQTAFLTDRQTALLTHRLRRLPKKILWYCTFSGLCTCVTMSLLTYLHKYTHTHMLTRTCAVRGQPALHLPDHNICIYTYHVCILFLMFMCVCVCMCSTRATRTSSTRSSDAARLSTSSTNSSTVRRVQAPTR
jgi:hypothetical protein